MSKGPKYNGTKIFKWLYVTVLFYFILNILFYFTVFYFLAALGLRCCTQAFSSCGKWGLLLVAVHGLLIAVASLVAEHGL